MTKAECKGALNCSSDVAFRNWLKEGMPVLKEQGKWARYDIEAIHEWFAHGWFDSLSEENQKYHLQQFYGLFAKSGKGGKNGKSG